MHWLQVKIEDLKGELYTGESARDFVVDRLAGKLTISLYSGGTFALKVDKKFEVAPDAVYRILSDKLAGQVRALEVEGRTTAFPSTYVPRRTKTNPINVVPKYSLTIELGDIDALFEPVANTAEPWKDEGVKQRLQALGYLYTPLKHPGNNELGKFNHSKACWEYYKRVHKPAPDAQPISDSEALTKLKEEIGGNLISNKFPSKDQKILPKSKLPVSKAFAAIRFPGGYGATKSPVTQLSAGDHFFNQSNASSPPAKYEFRIGDRRSDIEKLVFEENDFLGRFPLIVFVTADWGKGRIEPVSGVPVYFQLVHPDVLEEGNSFRAADPPDKVMDYSYNLGAFNFWQVEPPEGIAIHFNKLDDQQPGESKQADNTPSITLDPSKDTWINAKRRASEIAKEGDTNSEAAIAKAEEEVKTQQAIQKKLMRDRNQIFGPAANREESKYKKYEQEKLGPIHKEKVRADAEKIQAEEKVLQLENILKLRKLKIQPAPKATGGFKITYKSKEAEEEAKKKADERRKEKEAEAVRLRDEITRLESDIENARKDFQVADRRLSEAGKKYDEAAIILKKEYPDRAAFDSALKNQEVADQKMEESLRKERTASNEINARRKAAREELAVKITDDDIRSCVFYILSKSALDFNPTLDINIYLNANHGDNPDKPSEIRNAGQRIFIENLLKELEKKAGEENPQKRNAYKDYGGKSGLPVEASIFETKSRQRFNDGHSNYGVILDASKGSYPDAVKCNTNQKGYSGVIFTPSHCGGDTYKIRAFIDPEWLEMRANYQNHDSVADTGTMVVWRNIRINRYLQMTNPKRPFSAKLNEVLNTGADSPNRNPNFDLMSLDSDLIRLSLLPEHGPEAREYEKVDITGLSLNDYIKYRPVKVKPTSLKDQLGWGYCELIADGGLEVLTPQEKKKALERGFAAIQKAWTAPKNVDWRTLIFEDETSPFLCNFLSLETYNKSVGPEYPKLKKEDDRAFFAVPLCWFYDAILEQLAEGGVLPGITILQIPRADTWDPHACNLVVTVTSGYGTAGRGFYISHTEGVYHGVFRIYPNTSNAIHELGHVLGLAHQPPAQSSIEDAHQKPVKGILQSPKADQCVCVMSYNGCYGDYCGKCLLSLRGWKQSHENDLYNE